MSGKIIIGVGGSGTTLAIAFPAEKMRKVEHNGKVLYAIDTNLPAEEFMMVLMKSIASECDTIIIDPSDSGSCAVSAGLRGDRWKSEE